MKLPLPLRAQAAMVRAILRLPPSVLVRLVGGAAVAKDGCVLDPQMQMLTWLAARLGRGARERTNLSRARMEFDREASAFVQRFSPLAAVWDERIGTAVRVRIYRPHGARTKGPAVLFFHGGGFVLGGIASHDPICRALAHDTGFVVLSVDYRLAPEHPFPAAADDATEAFRWAVRSAGSLDIDPQRMAVMGDSAGGNLAAVVCLDTRNDRVRPCFQSLVYPVVDSTWLFPSMETMATGGLLEREAIRWFRQAYAPDPTQWSLPRVSPWFADVTGLSPALVQTAGFDPLRDEAEAYGEKLRAAGVPVQLTRYPSLSHGYLNFLGTVSAVDKPWHDLVSALRSHLAAS
jgi:acetyl esterase